MNELSVVIPYLSKTEALPTFLDELATYLMENPADVDVIIVANEDTDLDQYSVKQLRSKYSWLKLTILKRKRYRGYGSLMRFGIAYSTSRYVVLLSAYGDDDVGMISRMLKEIRKGAQLVQATRLPNEADRRIVSLKFRIYQNIYRFLIRILLCADIKDSSYSFKMFDRIFIQGLGLTQNGYSVSPEITLKTLLAEGKIVYISSKMKVAPINKNFKLYREGLGFVWLLVRGMFHRFGILWF